MDYKSSECLENIHDVINSDRFVMNMIVLNLHMLINSDYGVRMLFCGLDAIHKRKLPAKKCYRLKKNIIFLCNPRTGTWTIKMRQQSAETCRFQIPDVMSLTTIDA